MFTWADNFIETNKTIEDKKNSLFIRVKISANIHFYMESAYQEYSPKLWHLR